jgi:hypothetical protein
VYQPIGDDDDVDTEPSDSGYAGSTRSGSAGSTSGRGSSTPPEPIYYAPIELDADKKIKDSQVHHVVQLANRTDVVTKAIFTEFAQNEFISILGPLSN